MSNALERLRALSRQAGAKAPPGDSFPRSSAAGSSLDSSALRALLRIRHRGPSPTRSNDRDLPGEEVVPGLRLTQAFHAAPDIPDMLDGRFARREAIHTGNTLFFDTETTGLAGGVGSRAFMIGAADWVDSQLRVRQLTTTSTGAEPAMLEAFRTWIRPDTLLVSYNGRSYDAPLLAGRFRLARMGAPLQGIDHLDLLHPTRRRYKGCWENCRLGTIERYALGVVREDDLPGSEAPAAWLGYLRGGSADPLRGVFRHNHQDVVTLSTLLLHLAN